MEKLCAVISCLFLTVGSSQAQREAVKPLERPLPQWLMGIIAVIGFLFVSFLVFLVKKSWCDSSSRKSSSVEDRVTDVVIPEDNPYDTNLDLVRRNTKEKEDTYDTSLDLVRNKEERNSFHNAGFDSSEDRVTSM